MRKQYTSKIIINTESILRRGELIRIKRAADLLVRRPFLLSIRYNEMRAGLYTMREKHGGRKKERKRTQTPSNKKKGPTLYKYYMV